MRAIFMTVACVTADEHLQGASLRLWRRLQVSADFLTYLLA